MKRNFDLILITGISVSIFVLFVINLSLGDVAISFIEIFRILIGKPAEYDFWSYIVESRLNRSIAAIFGGGALAVSGLILQVFFRNPLAGPGVLGISSGASLGVAIVILGGMTLDNAVGGASIIMFGAFGAFTVLFLLLFLSRFVKSQITLLVIGLMIGYFTAAFVNILFLWANQSETREFVIWGLGSFEGLTKGQIWNFTAVISIFALGSIFMIKGLNGVVLGEDYARSLGINLKVQKVLMILITSILIAVVTAYCGPVSFIGIAVPQIVRLIAESKNHAILIPICFLGGGFLGIGADIIVRSTGNFLPLNTVTALIGAPIIIWTIIKMNRRFAGM